MARYALDVGNYEAVDKGVAQAVRDLGPIDVLINNVCQLLDLLKMKTWTPYSR